MKQVLLMIVVVALVGCGKSATPDEAANELFVEAIELVSKAKSEENTNIPAAIKSYEEALVKVRKILNEYKKSDLAVKLVSGETLFTGKSMAQIEERVSELQRELTRRAEEEMRRAEEEMRRAEEEMRRAEERRNAKPGTQIWAFQMGSAVISSPVIGSDGTVYVGSGDNKLYAIKTESLGLAKSPWPMRGQNARHTGRAVKK